MTHQNSVIPAERTTTTKHPVTDAGILEAIRLKSSACYVAVAICRAFGSGEQPEEWWLCSNFTLGNLADEAARRGLNLAGIINLDGRPVPESMKWRHAKGEVNDDALYRWWRGVKSGEIEP